MKTLLLFSLILGLPFAARAQTHQPSPADEAALRRVVTAFNDAFNAHDPKAFAATFAEDADFTNWMGTPAHGRAEIEKFHVPVLTVRYKNGSQKITDTKIRLVRSDVAEVEVRSEVIGGLAPDGQPVPPMKFMLNWTVTKNGTGQWLIEVMHNARLPEATAPPLNQKN